MNSLPEAAFFSVIAVLTAASLWRELPLQYVITVVGVMYGLAALSSWLLRQPCWWLPLIVLNSRGVSRLVLRKWSEGAFYGWWMMGTTCMLSTALMPRWIAPLLALAMQIAAVPWLIKRRPTAEGPNYFPVVNWLIIAFCSAAIWVR